MDTHIRRVARTAPGALFLLLTFEWSGCAPAKRTPRGGAGGAAAGGAGGGGGGGFGGSGGVMGGGFGGSGGGGTGGATGGAGGSGGNGGSGGSGGAAGMDAGASDLARDTAGTEAPAGDAGTVPPGDAPPRPDGMGQACAVGQNYGFTIRQFPSQNGTFTAYFTARPSNAPTNSVIGLSDGQKYIHDAFAAIVRFGTSGNLDARNGAAYSSLTPIRYMVTDYNFRLVVNVPAKTYSAYVSWGGMPEVTIGTDLAFRDSAGTVNKLDYWGVEAINPHMTRVCGFQVQ